MKHNTNTYAYYMLIIEYRKKYQDEEKYLVFLFAFVHSIHYSFKHEFKRSDRLCLLKKRTYST